MQNIVSIAVFACIVISIGAIPVDHADSEGDESAGCTDIGYGPKGVAYCTQPFYPNVRNCNPAWNKWFALQRCPATCSKTSDEKNWNYKYECRGDTQVATADPTHEPSKTPTETPTTQSPSTSPSHTPTEHPTHTPSETPTFAPTELAKPTLPGCWILFPNSCPNHLDGHGTGWTRDTYMGSGHRKDFCLNRCEGQDVWCGMSAADLDCQSHFVEQPPSPPAPPASPTPTNAECGRRSCVHGVVPKHVGSNVPCSAAAPCINTVGNCLGAEQPVGNGGCNHYCYAHQRAYFQGHSDCSANAADCMLGGNVCFNNPPPPTAAPTNSQCGWRSCVHGVVPKHAGSNVPCSAAAPCINTVGNCLGAEQPVGNGGCNHYCYAHQRAYFQGHNDCSRNANDCMLGGNVCFT